MSEPPEGGGGEDDAGLDASATPDGPDHDWEWRRRIRANPRSRLILRLVVGVVGLIIVVIGLILVPFPGPGWPVVFLGLVVWATEFVWAQRLLQRARRTLEIWNDLLRPQPWWVKSLVLLATMAAVAVIFWLLFLISGVPGFFPDTVEQWLRKVPGLDH